MCQKVGAGKMKKKMNIKTIFVDRFNTSNRQGGVEFRERILKLIEEDNFFLEIDFSRVGIVSAGFADEAFALLLVQIGKDTWGKRICFRSMNKDVWFFVNKAFKQRSK